MSEKKKSIAAAKTHRRIRSHTRGAERCFGWPMREKPAQKIKVNEVLDCAEVGRSTFYSHYGSGHREPAAEMDKLYHCLVWSGAAMRFSSRIQNPQSTI